METFEARVNITFSGENGDLPDPVKFDASDRDILSWVTEAIATGGVPGISRDPAADLTDYVVDRFAASGDLPNRLVARPKTPFG